MNLDHVKRMVENSGTGLKPDEDWPPVLLMEKRGQMILFGLGGDCMVNQEAKDITAGLMAFLIQETQPDSAAFVSTAWSVEGKSKGRELDLEEIRSGKANRIEIVVCVCVSPVSEAVLAGKILRSPNSHPKIKEWKTIDGGGDGRFIEAMRKGFRKEINGGGKT